MASRRRNQNLLAVVRDCDRPDTLQIKIPNPSSKYAAMTRFFFIVLLLLWMVVFYLNNTLSFVYSSNRRSVADINLLYKLGKEISSIIERYNEEDLRHGQLLYWMGGTTSLAAARNIPAGFFESDDSYHFYFQNDQLNILQSVFPKDHQTLTLKYLTDLGYYQIAFKNNNSVFGNMYPVKWNAEINAYDWIDSVGKVVSTHRFNLPDKNVTKYLTNCKFYDFTFQCMKMTETEKYLSEVFGKADTMHTSFINNEGMRSKRAKKYEDYHELLPALTHKILNNMRGIGENEEFVKDNEEYVNENIFRRFLNFFLLTLTRRTWMSEKGIDDTYDLIEQITTTINEYNMAHLEDPFIYWIAGGTSLAATRNTPPGMFQWDDDLDFSFYEGKDDILAKVFPKDHPTVKFEWRPHCTFWKIILKSNSAVVADFIPSRWNDTIMAYSFIDQAKKWFPTQHYYFPTPIVEDHLIECPFYDFSFPCAALSDRMRSLSDSYGTNKIMAHARVKNHKHAKGYYDLTRTKNFHFLQPALTPRIVKQMQAFSYIKYP